MTQGAKTVAHTVGQTVRIKQSGRLVRLDDINSNPNHAADNEHWGSGWYLDGGGTTVIDADHDIEKVDLKPIPTAEQIADQIAQAMHGGYDEPVVVRETSQDGATIEDLGRDAQGVPVAFRVIVHQVQRAEL